jgi:AcrR family transcriptional regulator
MWTPNQQSVRARIASAAARVVARSGIAACTVRAVAAEAGLTKSTVHYYLRDSNELVDLAVLGFLDALADYAASLISAAADGLDALYALVRMFTTGEGPPIAMSDPTLWSDFATHAWRRGAFDELALCLDTFSSLFEHALALVGVDNVQWRARSIHLYLLGTLNRKLVAGVPTDEVAYAVSALAGVVLDPERCGLTAAPSDPTPADPPDAQRTQHRLTTSVAPEKRPRRNT